MRYTQVYIGDEIIDLVPGQAIAMTYQLNAIGDVKNQLANFSNVFKAARTKENDRKLGFISDLNSTDKRPYRLLPARIIIDGEDVVTNGFATIKKTDGYYNILVYSGLLDLYTKLGDLTLADLDLSAYDHTLDIDTIVGLMPSTIGICYPLIDYGQNIISSSLLDYMRFSVYLNVIFEQILTNAGFEFSGSFFDHPDYSKLLLPFTNEKFTNKDSALKGSFTSDNGTGFFVNNPDSWETVEGFEVQTGNTGGCFTLGLQYLVGDNAVRGKFSFEGEIHGSGNYAIRIFSSVKGIVSYAKGSISGAFSAVKLTPDNIDYVAGELISMQVMHHSGAGVTVKGRFNFKQDTAIPWLGFVPVTENLPNMKQKDLVKALAQIYGLIYDIDLQTQEVRVRFFDDILTNKIRAKDWSNKLDLSVQDDITYQLEGVAQINHFQYNNGTTIDSTPQDYIANAPSDADAGNVPFKVGHATALIDDQNLKASQVATDLPFAATEEYTNRKIILPFDDVKLPLIKIYVPTLFLTDPMYNDSNGLITNTPPWIYTDIHYASPPLFDITVDYFPGQRVKLAGCVYEFQGSEAAIGKVPGVDLDNGDTGTSYTGIPVWKPIAIDTSLLFTQRTKVKPRILKAVSFNRNIFFQTEQYPEDVPTTGGIIKPVFEGVLDFTTRLEANYKVYQDSAQNTKVVQAYFTLVPEDIKGLDFLIPIYVGYYANYFYLSRIDKYQQGDSTAVDLIRI